MLAENGVWLTDMKAKDLAVQLSEYDEYFEYHHPKE